MKKEYVLTNGTKFIKQNIDGQWKQVSNLALADTYQTQKSATNVMLNSLPKPLSRLYYVAKIENGKVIRCNVSRPDKPIKQKTESLYVSQQDLNSSEWCKNFIGLDEVFEKALKRGSKVAQELSDIDLDVSDIIHYIEFSTLDVFSGYLAYKMLHDTLKKRRNLKNEHKIIDAINKNQIVANNIIQILQAIEECKSQVYVPRKNSALFEKGISGIKSMNKGEK